MHSWGVKIPDDQQPTAVAPTPAEIAFRQDFDKLLEHNLEQKFSWLLKNLYGYQADTQMGGEVIWDSDFIAEVKGVFSPLRRLFLKYHEDKALAAMEEWKDSIKRLNYLNTADTIEHLEILEASLLKDIAVKHKFMDKTEDKEPWESKVKKKLELRDFNEAEQKYYDTKKQVWKKLIFFGSMYVVVRKGDMQMLLSAPNNGGKTNTALPFLREFSKDIVDFWCKQPEYKDKLKPWNEEYLKKHPERADDKITYFKISRDVIVTPSATDIKNRMSYGQYQAIDINEPMEAATNLQSMQRDVIAMGVKRYTSRDNHNFLIWEYQVAKRPTGLMLEGMNFWVQKMSLKWCVLSMASSISRDTDPYFMVELSKCRTDRERSRWFVKKNPNFIMKFRSPRMKPKYEERFRRHYQKEQEKKKISDDARGSMTTDYYNMLVDFDARVNGNSVSPLAKIDIRTELVEKVGYDEHQVAKFMRDFEKYEATQKYLRYRKKEEMVA